jgi:hypothetical protein
VKTLIELTNIKPSKDNMDRLYRRVLSHDPYHFPDRVRKISLATGENPDPEIMQEIYLSAILKNSSILKGFEHRLGILDELKELTRQNILSDTIRNAYSYLLGKMYSSQYSELKEYSGVEPTDEMVQQIYMASIQKNRFGYIYRLKNMTGVIPSEEVISALVDNLMAPVPMR